MAREQISEDTPLQPGDRIFLVFKTFNHAWMQGLHLAILERGLQRTFNGFRVRSWGPTDDGLEMEIIIQQPMSSDPQVQRAGVITPAVIITLVVGVIAPIVWWVSLKGVFREVAAAPVTAVAAGASVVGMVGLVIVLWFLLSKKT